MKDKDEEKIIDYAPATKAGGKRYWIVLSLLFVVTWAAIGVLWIYTGVNINGTTGKQETEALKTHIRKLESNILDLAEKVAGQRVRSLTRLPAELPDTGVGRKDSIEIDSVTREELDIVAERVKLLERDIEGLRNLESEIEKTKELTAKMSKGTYGPLIIALSQVQKQISKGVPFDMELKLVTIEAGDDAILLQHIKILEAHSKRGIAAVEQLRDDFRLLAGTIVKEAKKAKANSLWDRTKNEIVDMISVRRVDNLSGNSAEAIVARAEKALDHFNITEAVLELGALEKKPKLVISEWLVNASARVAVEYALDGILKHVAQTVVKNKSTS